MSEAFFTYYIIPSYTAKYFLVLLIKTAKRETACGREASPQPHCAVILLDSTRKHAFNKK